MRVLLYTILKHYIPCSFVIVIYIDIDDHCCVVVCEVKWGGVYIMRAAIISLVVPPQRLHGFAALDGFRALLTLWYDISVSINAHQHHQCDHRLICGVRYN
jgi:hypothetical protein